MAFLRIIAICAISGCALSWHTSDPDGISFVVSFSMFCLIGPSMFVHVITLCLNFYTIFSTAFWKYYLTNSQSELRWKDHFLCIFYYISLFNCSIQKLKWSFSCTTVFSFEPTEKSLKDSTEIDEKACMERLDESELFNLKKRLNIERHESLQLRKRLLQGGKEKSVFHVQVG